jgi:transcriptional regulator with XRE-family HTH domain
MADWNRVLGDNVRRLRKAKGFSQEKLAQQAGLTVRHVGRVERGEGGTSLRMVVAIAEALGVTPPELLQPAESPDRDAS